MNLTSRIALTLAALAVVGLMVWDQLRIDGMTPMKWAMLPGMVVIVVGPIWMQ